MGQLNAEPVGAVVVLGNVLSGRKTRFLVHLPFALVYIGIGHIQGPVLVDIPAETQGVDLAIADRDANGTMLVTGR